MKTEEHFTEQASLGSNDPVASEAQPNLTQVLGLLRERLDALENSRVAFQEEICAKSKGLKNTVNRTRTNYHDTLQAIFEEEVNKLLSLTVEIDKSLSGEKEDDFKNSLKLEQLNFSKWAHTMWHMLPSIQSRDPSFVKKVKT